MNSRLTTCVFGILVLALAGCFNSRRVLKLDFNIPEQPQNFSALNTQWDDYNASAPIGWERRNGPGGPLFWSTNRGSQGAQFDIWRADIQVSHVNGYHLGMTDTIFPEDRNKTWDGEAKPMTSANSPGNEFGPVVYCGDAPADPWRPKGYAGADLLEEKGCTLVFASDRPGGKGGLDLYRAQPPGGVPSPITTLNSSGNDSYWTYAGEDHPAAYFASDRGGHGYKIYEICWKDPAKPQPFGGPGAEIRMVPEVAGDGDDTAPYIFWRDGLNMVFASNRSGGQGGFDLWFSHYGKNGWDKPLNLGPRVNSPQDEFRPSVTDKDLLIFSSNRPGGKGGFDLYYAKFISPN